MIKISKKNFVKITLICVCASLCFSFSAFSQTKKRNPRKSNPQPTATVEPKQAETLTEEFPEPKTQIKKNARPTDETAKSDSRPSEKSANTPIYSYEFSQPDFLISKIKIEHDETGKGAITILEKNFAEPVSDPIQLSAATLERVKTLWNALNFLDSAEIYQSSDKNYAHLGVLKFTMKKGERERAAEFNWTENKDARALADEYRKISNQFVWIFDVGVARENQPLETPRLLDRLDSLVKRDEIADSEQLISFLKKLSDDERLPLISRNHALRLIQQIEKQTAKVKNDKN